MKFTMSGEEHARLARRLGHPGAFRSGGELVAAVVEHVDKKRREAEHERKLEQLAGDVHEQRKAELRRQFAEEDREERHAIERELAAGLGIRVEDLI